MKRTRVLFTGNSHIILRNRTFLQWAVMIVAFWSILFKPISMLSGMLSYLKYVPDGILLVLLILTMGKKRLTLRNELLIPLRLIIIYFCFCCIVGIFRYQSFAYGLWGFRNNYRFYIAFFAFIAYLEWEDVGTWFKVMDALFWINAILSAVQFFFLGVSGDFLGGIFGVLGASNGYTLCFMSVVIGKSLLEAFTHKEKIVNSLIKSIVAILVATMAEMKFFFFVVVFLMLGAMVITGVSIRKIVFVVMGMIALSVGAIFLVETFGFEDFFSLEKLWERATQKNYSNSGDINRLSAINSLTSRFSLSPIDQMFGLGMGNCDTSSFEVCNTPFFQKNGHIHYTWFVSAMLFLETGYLGLALYISFFAICFVQAYKNRKNQAGNLLYNQLAILISLLCIILVFYDFSLRAEPGYMMYFVLALPFIWKKSE